MCIRDRYSKEQLEKLAADGNTKAKELLKVISTKEKESGWDPIEGWNKIEGKPPGAPDYWDQMDGEAKQDWIDQNSPAWGGELPGDQEPTDWDKDWVFVGDVYKPRELSPTQFNSLSRDNKLDFYKSAAPSWFWFTHQDDDGNIIGNNYSGHPGMLVPAQSRPSEYYGQPESGYGTPGFNYETNSGGTPWTFIGWDDIPKYRASQQEASVSDKAPARSDFPNTRSGAQQYMDAKKAYETQTEKKTVESAFKIDEPISKEIRDETIKIYEKDPDLFRQMALENIPDELDDRFDYRFGGQWQDRYADAPYREAAQMAKYNAERGRDFPINIEGSNFYGVVKKPYTYDYSQAVQDSDPWARQMHGRTIDAAYFPTGTLSLIHI